MSNNTEEPSAVSHHRLSSLRGEREEEERAKSVDGRRPDWIYDTTPTPHTTTPTPTAATHKTKDTFLGERRERGKEKDAVLNIVWTSDELSRGSAGFRCWCQADDDTLNDRRSGDGHGSDR